jgi:hypothetical protein
LKAIEQKEPERILFLAVPNDVFKSFFLDDLPRMVIESNNVHVLSFDSDNEMIVTWKR